MEDVQDSDRDGQRESAPGDGTASAAAQRNSVLLLLRMRRSLTALASSSLPADPVRRSEERCTSLWSARSGSGMWPAAGMGDDADDDVAVEDSSPAKLPALGKLPDELAWPSGTGIGTGGAFCCCAGRT